MYWLPTPQTPQFPVSSSVTGRERGLRPCQCVITDQPTLTSQHNQLLSVIILISISGTHFRRPAPSNRPIESLEFPCDWLFPMRTFVRSTYSASGPVLKCGFYYAADMLNTRLYLISLVYQLYRILRQTKNVTCVRDRVLVTCVPDRALVIFKSIHVGNSNASTPPLQTCTASDSLLANRPSSFDCT